MLRKDLGINWYQLATQMGLRKTPIDEIQGMPHATVESKIDTFLEEYPFPLFQNDRQTAEFLVETLERASLSTIVVDVKRDLELVLNLEGIQFSEYTPVLSFQSTSDCMSCFSVIC